MEDSNTVIVDCPFDRHIHIQSKPIDDATRLQIDQLRGLLSDHEVYHSYQKWCTDQQLHRFLIARHFNLQASKDTILAALQWRMIRIPPLGVESLSGWEERMSKEGETGKIYIPGCDRFGRPIIVCDDSAQNTVDENGRLNFMAWYLEYACRLMPSYADKYMVFIHLENYSIFGGPSMKALQETIFMVTNAFPERLGHCIIYRPPTAFRMLWNTLKGLIDTKTSSKILFITGDVRDGSENDLKLQEIIGADWKILCGGEQPVRKKGNTPGYLHEEYWPMSMARYTDMLRREQALLEPQKPAGVADGLRPVNPSEGSCLAGDSTTPTDQENFKTSDDDANCHGSGNITCQAVPESSDEQRVILSNSRKSELDSQSGDESLLFSDAEAVALFDDIAVRYSTSVVDMLQGSARAGSPPAMRIIQVPFAELGVIRDADSAPVLIMTSALDLEVAMEESFAIERLAGAWLLLGASRRNRHDARLCTRLSTSV